MSETKMRVSAEELAAIVAAIVDDGERFTFDRIQDGYEDKVPHAVLIDREGEPVGVPLRRDVEPMLSLVRRLARDLAEERKAKALVLSVKAQWVDDGAAARVTPGQAEGYLRRTGWTWTDGEKEWATWAQDGEYVVVPQHPEFRDYPRRMSDLIRTLADIEKRSPIAVWLDLLAEAT